MSTIKDIAAATGLSVGTVSKYLNGGTLRPQNRQAIDEAITALDFHINETARSLKTNRSRLIGVVIPELSNIFITTVLTEVEDILRQHGYGVIVSDCRSNPDIQQNAIDFMLSRQVDGIINMPVDTSGDHLQPVFARNLPVVLVDRNLPDCPAHYIGINNVQAGRMGTELLLRNGHKKIAILAGPTALPTANHRLMGYLSALQDYGITPDESLIVDGQFTIEGSAQCVRTLLQTHPEITALFTASYEMTIGALKALTEIGIQIPQQLSMVGFGNIQMAQILNPRLTIVTQPTKEIAVQVANTMLNLLGQRPSPPQTILKPFVKQGASVRPIL